MTYDPIIENNLTESKISKSFEGSVGSIIELQLDVKEIITNVEADIQVVIQESDDNESFSDSMMTKVYCSAPLDDTFVFQKQKPYHRFYFDISGTNASIDIELNQSQLH